MADEAVVDFVARAKQKQQVDDFVARAKGGAAPAAAPDPKDTRFEIGPTGEKVPYTGSMSQDEFDRLQNTNRLQNERNAAHPEVGGIGVDPLKSFLEGSGVGPAIHEAVNSKKPGWESSIAGATNAVTAALSAPLTAPANIAHEIAPAIVKPLDWASRQLDTGAQAWGWLAKGAPDAPTRLPAGAPRPELPVNQAVRAAGNLVVPAVLGAEAMRFGGAGLKALGKTPGGKAFTAGMARGRAPAVEATVPPVGPTEYGMPRTRMVGPSSATEFKPGEPIRLQPSEFATPEQIAKLRAETSLAQHGDEVPMQMSGRRPGPSITPEEAQQLRAETRAAESPEGLVPAERGFKPNMPIESGQSDAGVQFDENGLVRTRTFRGRGMRGESGALALPDPGKIGEFIGRMDRRFGGGETPPSEVGVPPAPSFSPDRPGAVPLPLDRSVEQLKRHGPAGEALSNDLQNVDARMRQIRGQVGEPLDQARAKLSLRERTSAQKNLSGWANRSIPTPEWAAPLVDAWRETAGRARDVTNASGSMVVPTEGPARLIGHNPDYFPTTPTPEAVMGLKAENGSGPLTTEFTEANPGKKNPFVREPTDTEAMVRRKNEAVEGFFAGTERAHEFNWPESMQKPNKLDVADNYLHRMAQNAAEHEVFKYRYETKAGDTVKTEGRLRQHFDAIGDRPVQGARAGAADAEFQTLRILGRQGVDAYGPGKWNAFVKGFNKWEGLYTTASKLGLSVSHVFTRGGHLPLFMAEVGPEVAAKALSRVATKYGEVKASAQRSGAFRPGETEMLRSGVETPQSPGKVYRALNATTRVVTAVPDAISKFVQLAAAEAAPEHMANIQKGLAKGGKAANFAERQMGRLDLAPEDMMAIRSGEISPLLRDKFAQRLADYVNLSASPADRPAFMGNPKLAWLGRFKDVHAAATRAFLDTAIAELRHGNPKPLGIMIAGAVALYSAKHELQKLMGRQEDPDEKGLIEAAKDKDTWGVVKYLAKATASVGTAGALGAPLEAPFGTRNQLSQLGQREALPPIAGSIANFTEQLANAATRKTARDYAAQGRSVPIYKQAGREQVPTTRGDAWERALWDFVTKEFPQVTRDAKAVQNWTQ